MGILSYIDHAILKPDSGLGELYWTASQPWANEVASICVKPFYVREARKVFQPYIPISTVLAYPHGNTGIALSEAKQAIKDGAIELDMVINVAVFKETGRLIDVEELYTYTRKNGCILKVILETCYLTEYELNLACKRCEDIGVPFTKTSTGFGPKGATKDAVLTMLKYSPSVKASGGIGTLKEVEEYIGWGVERVGTSNTERIYNELTSRS